MITEESSESDLPIIEEEYDVKSQKYLNSFKAFETAQVEYAKEAGYKIEHHRFLLSGK